MKRFVPQATSRNAFFTGALASLLFFALDCFSRHFSLVPATRETVEISFLVFIFFFTAIFLVAGIELIDSTTSPESPRQRLEIFRGMLTRLIMLGAGFFVASLLTFSTISLFPSLG